MTLKLYEIEFVEELEFENKRLTADAACNEAQLKNIVGYVEQLQVKVEQLEGALAVKKRRHLNTCFKLVVPKGDT